MAAYSVAITCSANAQTESKMMMTMGAKAAPHKVLTSIPSPQSGIKLIEYISQKMHTIKGSVIAKNPTYTSAPQEKSQGPTNQLLAIKPPVSGYAGPREQDRESASDKKSAPVEEQKAKKKADSDSARAERSTLGDDSANGSYGGGGTLSYGRRQSAVPASNSLSRAKEASIASRSDYNTTATAYGRMANGKMGKALAGLSGALAQVDEGMRAADSASKDIGATKARARSPRTEASYQIASNKPSGLWEAPVRGVLLQQPGLTNSANVRDNRTTAAAGSNSYDQAAAEPQSPPMPPSVYRTTSQRLPSTVMGKHIFQPGDNQYSFSTAGGAGAGNVRDYYKSAPQSTIASASVPSAAPVPSQQAQGFMVPPPPAVTD